jgi:putative DNA methylase
MSGDSVIKRKLIEVALPLDAINRESAREKSIRHGHPSTLHLWWARRPLAACRAVLFAQLVDDPSAHPERFPTVEEQDAERKRLFELIERLVVWENAGNAQLLREAYDEIAKCFDGKPPAILDPFAGGGSIPLEAQRLGLEAHASDLNPVAVLINKALVEIPPRWAGQAPVFPGAAEARLGEWPRATGLAEDVRRYGQWMRDEAEQRIGHLYPKAKLPDGSTTTVIAWIWARTVACPNPACAGKMPLARSFWLSKKKDRPSWLKPVVEGKQVRFEIAVDPSGPGVDGTVGRQGAVCLVCETPVPLRYIRAEGQAGRMGSQLMAVVAEGNRQRVYLTATDEQVAAADIPGPDDVPEAELPEQALGFRVQGYGMNRWVDLFTNRQLVALTTFSDLVGETCRRMAADASAFGITDHDAESYASAVATYLGIAASRLIDRHSSVGSWDASPTKEQVRGVFARQAIPMTWDFAEGNPYSRSSGNLTDSVEWVARVVDRSQPSVHAYSAQADAATLSVRDAVVSTDPPYYDNIGYADLSDFFYVWLRRSLQDVYPDLLGTMLTPKADELVADRSRFAGSKERADEHFESGFVRTFTRIRESHPLAVPITVFYAFKQAETDEVGTASTGWETMLSGLIQAGLTITATWPMRSELGNRMRNIDSNALASSIVLACRPRQATAGATTRRGFLQALKDELPNALRDMQQGSVAPVDMAQAAIGPGMAVFTRFSTVVEADGSAMTVRTALALINHALDEVLSEQEGDFDADTRFCVKWFEQFGWDEKDSGPADDLSRARNTSVGGLVRGGIFWSRAGRARLLQLHELSDDWDPASDERVSVWEVVVRLAKALNESGGEEAARLMALAGQRVDLDTAKELAYLLFTIAGKRGMTETAILFNGLGTSWLDLESAARRPGAGRTAPIQGSLDYDEE